MSDVKKNSSRLIIEDGYIKLLLSEWETLGALHNSPVMPIDEITGVNYYDDLWSSKILRGFRAPGTGVPFLVMLGTMRTMKWKAFCAIYKRRPGVVIDFKSGPFDQWIFTMPHDLAHEVLDPILAA